MHAIKDFSLATTYLLFPSHPSTALRVFASSTLEKYSGFKKPRSSPADSTTPLSESLNSIPASSAFWTSMKMRICEEFLIPARQMAKNQEHVLFSMGAHRW